MNNELFIVKPSLRQFYGRTVTKELTFDETTDDKSVHQVLKDCVLTTEINKTWKQGEIENTLKSTMSSKLSEGTVLVWSEEEGYIVPNVSVYKLRDLEADIISVKEVYKDNTDINPKG